MRHRSDCIIVLCTHSIAYHGHRLMPTPLLLRSRARGSHTPSVRLVQSIVAAAEATGLPSHRLRGSHPSRDCTHPSVTEWGGGSIVSGTSLPSRPCWSVPISGRVPRAWVLFSPPHGCLELRGTPWRMGVWNSWVSGTPLGVWNSSLDRSKPARRPRWWRKGWTIDEAWPAASVRHLPPSGRLASQAPRPMTGREVIARSRPVRAGLNPAGSRTSRG
jgi:hypothetical protein